jgi:hypothetical protein
VELVLPVNTIIAARNRTDVTDPPAAGRVEEPTLQAGIPGAPIDPVVAGTAGVRAAVEKVRAIAEVPSSEVARAVPVGVEFARPAGLKHPVVTLSDTSEKRSSAMLEWPATLTSIENSSRTPQANKGNSNRSKNSASTCTVTALWSMHRRSDREWPSE